MKTQYFVVNLYGTDISSRHYKPETALHAASKREGTGWIVLDSEGQQWTWNGDIAITNK